MKLITIIGARPQFIKASALFKSMELVPGSSLLLEQKILHTGQHYDSNMSDCFFDDLGIPQPSYELGIGGGTHGANTGRMLEEIEKILIADKFDGVIVYGDTDSTLAGSLAASKLKIPVFHVEAGLRSFNRSMPEEQNRVITDHLSELCFAPTPIAIQNLRSEGIAEERIVKTGDIMADTARIFSNSLNRRNELLKRLGCFDKKFILATIHRAENVDNPQKLLSILSALARQKIPVLLPLHPRTKARIEQFNLHKLIANLQITEPLGYLDMVMLEKKANLIITDSGGIQKEAYFQGTPCVTIREETEWVELIDTGWNKLADPNNEDAIVESIYNQLNFQLSQPRPNLYGDGFSAKTIISKLLSYFNLQNNLKINL